MGFGAKYAIIPSIEPIDAENKNVTYFSSDTSVATVDEYGVVTALKGGSCVIEVTTEECHLTAACTIVVKEYVSSITLSETDKFMNVGATENLLQRLVQKQQLTGMLYGHLQTTVYVMLIQRVI